MKRRPAVLLSLLVFACTTPANVDEEATTRAPAERTVSPPEEQGDIYVMRADGRGMKRLTRHPLTDGTPVVWSPRGDRIMYGRGVDGYSGTYIMNADGSGPIELLPPQAGSVAGSWGSDGTIVLSSNRSGSNLLYTVSEDGTHLRPIPNSEEGDYFPVASPDGSKIAFMSYDGPESDIWIMSNDGTERVALAVAPLAQKWTTWSPDGTKLAYHDLPSETIGIAEIDSGLSRVLKLERPALMPAWSPDGHRMAFVSDGNVCTVTLADRRTVCFERRGEEYGPAWSPDSRRIAFVYLRK